MRIAGIDGCKAGWIVVIRESDGELRSVIARNAAEIGTLNPPPAAAAIDIPIGLQAVGPRRCDQAARVLLGARRSSVFPAPIRAVLKARDWDEACAIRFALEGGRMSKQAWGIVSKIREVDTLLRSDLGVRRWLKEFHPELSFREWRGEPMSHAKKRSAGRSERQALVARHFGKSAFQQVRDAFRRSLVADDDILDAFAGLWTASRIVNGDSLRVPGSPSFDEHGLPMEMVC